MFCYVADFLLNHSKTTEIYTLSLHDALPIFLFLVLWLKLVKDFLKVRCRLALLPFLISCLIWLDLVASLTKSSRSEERFSRNAETDLVCRLLLEKKKVSRNKIK